jgi:uncharacterized protein YjbI with pentapeptide repeats
VLGYGGLSQEIVAYLWELLAESNIDRLRLFNRLHDFYQRWCQSEFLDAPPNENLPQKKLLQLRDQDIPTGLRQVDVFAGLNAMIFLFKLHADAQPEDYPNLPDDAPCPEIWFHPCGEPGTDGFNAERLLKIIYYADALGITTFATTVGPHLASANLESIYLASAILPGVNLSSAKLSNASLSGTNFTRATFFRANLNNTMFDSAFLFRTDFASAKLDGAILFRADLSHAYLDSANLTSANLVSANLTSANLTSTNLTNADLGSANLDSVNFTSANLDSSILFYTSLDSANFSDAKLDRTFFIASSLRLSENLIPSQLEGDNPPMLCGVTLPPDIILDPNRDWNRLAVMLHERYSNMFKTLGAAEKWVEKHRPH